ncbi:MAG TPA: hypothetical protein PLR18_02570 [bacterium]|nr:hypothetical protein [bacterium]
MENQEAIQAREEKPKEKWIERLQGPSDLLTAAVNIYRQKFLKIMALYGITILSFLPLAAVFGLYWFINKGVGMDITVKAILQVILGLAGLAAIIWAIFCSLAAQVGIYLAPESPESEKIMELFKRGRNLAGKYLVVSFVVGIFTFLWMLLLIVPGIIMSVYYSFAVLCLIYEGYRAGKALKRSKELVKGYWWSVAGRTIFIGLVMWLVIIILSIPLWVVDENSLLAEIWGMIVNVASYLIAPVGTIYSYLIFKNLQKIKGVKTANN